MMNVVVCYAPHERGFAGLIVGLLEIAGFEVEWNKTPGVNDIVDRVNSLKVALADCAVVAWTNAAADDLRVMEELQRAVDHEVLVLLAMDESRPPPPWDALPALDLARWDGDPRAPAWKAVVEAVSRLVDAPGAPPRRTTSFTAGVQASRSGSLFLLGGLDGRGKSACWLVSIRPGLEAAFTKASESAEGYDLDDYGEEILSCYGEELTPELKEYVRARYGFET